MARDIDQIIETVKERLPDVEIDQWQKMHAADDDGLWFFSRPGRRGEIQLESSSGNCPFIVESDGETRPNEASSVKTVDDAIQSVTRYLSAPVA